MATFDPKARAEANILTRELIEWENLLSQPGWKRLEKIIYANEQNAYNGMIKGPSELATHKAIGTYHTCRSVRLHGYIEIVRLRDEIRKLSGQAPEEIDPES